MFIPGVFSSPYTVNLSSETFTKITEEIEPKYSRSIAWLDSSGAYLQVRAEPFRLKMPDGSEQLLDFLPVSLDTFNLTPANSWELLASLPAPLPADAESLLVDFTIDGESLERIAVQPGSTARGAIRLLGRNNQVLATLLGPSFTLSGNLPAARYRLGFALGQIGIPPNTSAVKANVIINGSNASKSTFASLGHIFDFNGQVAPGAPKQTSGTNAAAMSGGEEVPGAFRLESNYPNPFNPSTTIRYQVPRPARIKITVYNLLGEEIRRLVDETVSEGIHEIAWDGRDEQGNFAGSGVYFLRLSAVSGPQQFSDTKKILLLK